MIEFKSHLFAQIWVYPNQVWREVINVVVALFENRFFVRWSHTTIEYS